MLTAGDASASKVPLRLNTLYYLGGGRDELPIASASGSRLLLIGGAPFGETILIWWNFVARTAEEIADARRSWEQHELFGDVPAYKGPRLSAPDVLGRPIRS
jgi:hypothetical protein